MGRSEKRDLFRGPVVILGRPFRLVYQKDIIDGRGRFCEGLMDQELEVIRLQAGMSRARQEEAILHEIIEALNAALECRLRHPVIMGLARGLWAAGVRYLEPHENPGE